jgi:hypothetical protein
MEAPYKSGFAIGTKCEPSATVTLECIAAIGPIESQPATTRFSKAAVLLEFGESMPVHVCSTWAADPACLDSGRSRTRVMGYFQA